MNIFDFLLKNSQHLSPTAHSVILPLKEPENSGFAKILQSILGQNSESFEQKIKMSENTSFLDQTKQSFGKKIAKNIHTPLSDEIIEPKTKNFSNHGAIDESFLKDIKSSETKKSIAQKKEDLVDVKPSNVWLKKHILHNYKTPVRSFDNTESQKYHSFKGRVVEKNEKMLAPIDDKRSFDKTDSQDIVDNLNEDKLQKSTKKITLHNEEHKVSKNVKKEDFSLNQDSQSAYVIVEKEHRVELEPFHKKKDRASFHKTHSVSWQKSAKTSQSRTQKLDRDFKTIKEYNKIVPFDKQSANSSKEVSNNIRSFAHEKKIDEKIDRKKLDNTKRESIEDGLQSVVSLSEVSVQKSIKKTSHQSLKEDRSKEPISKPQEKIAYNSLENVRNDLENVKYEDKYEQTQKPLQDEMIRFESNIERSFTQDSLKKENHYRKHRETSHTIEHKLPSKEFVQTQTLSQNITTRNEPRQEQKLTNNQKVELSFQNSIVQNSTNSKKIKKADRISLESLPNKNFDNQYDIKETQSLLHSKNREKVVEPNVPHNQTDIHTQETIESMQNFSQQDSFSSNERSEALRQTFQLKDSEATFEIPHPQRQTITLKLDQTTVNINIQQNRLYMHFVSQIPMQIHADINEFVSEVMQESGYDRYRVVFKDREKRIAITSKESQKIASVGNSSINVKV